MLSSSRLPPKMFLEAQRLLAHATMFDFFGSSEYDHEESAELPSILGHIRSETPTPNIAWNEEKEQQTKECTLITASD